MRNVAVKYIVLFIVLVLSGFIGNGQVITTVAGCGTGCPLGDGGQATAANINTCLGITFDGANNMYFIDYRSPDYRIRKVDGVTGIVTNYAGNGVAGFFGDGGPATAAQLSLEVTGIASDKAGNLYIVDRGNHRIRKIDNGTRIIHTIAGTGGSSYSGDGSLASLASCADIYGIAVDTSGNIYFSDSLRIRRIDAFGTTIRRYAGTGAYGFSGDGGPATAAMVGPANWMCTDRQGNLYFAGTATAFDRVRKINAAGVISTFAGNGTTVFGGEGAIATATGIRPVGVSADVGGNVFISDFTSKSIRVVTPSGLMYTVAGNGFTGFSGDGGAATNAKLDQRDIAVGRCDGDLYINDWNNKRIRKVTITPNTSITVLPDDTVCAGTTVTFKDTAIWSGKSASYQWAINGMPIPGATNSTISRIPVDHDYFQCQITMERGECSINRVVTSNSITIVTKGPGTIDGLANLCVGQTAMLSCTTTGGTWTSGNTVVATVGSASGIVSGQASGTVTITYMDGSCSSTKSMTVSVLPAITGVADFCKGSTLSLTNAVTGGTWTSSNSVIASVGSSDGIVSGVFAGTAVITYTAPGSCSVSAEINILPLPGNEPIAGPTGICTGDTVILTNILPGGIWSCSDTNIASLSATGMLIGVGQGSVAITYTISTICGISLSTKTIKVTAVPWPGVITGSPVVCEGVVFTLSSTVNWGVWSSANTTVATINNSTGVVTALKAGKSTIAYTLSPGSAGCPGVALYSVKVLNSPPYHIEYVVKPVSCFGRNDGRITVWTSGDTGVSKYLWTDGKTTPQLLDLGVGAYTVQVRELLSQCKDTLTLYVTQPDTLQAIAVVEKDICRAHNGSIALSAKGGIPPYKYLWNTGEASDSLAGLAGAVYVVDVTDSNGCSKKFGIEVLDTCTDIDIPGVITPNGDGINDSWVITGLLIYPSNTVQVFNKVGDLVFEQHDYSNGWSGQSRGYALPDGTYFYLIKLNGQGAKGKPSVYTGAVLIKR